MIYGKRFIIYVLMKFSTKKMGEIKMSEKKRFDKKRRVLKTGEIQKADGRYRYKYTNYDGKEAYVYSGDC